MYTNCHTIGNKDEKKKSANAFQLSNINTVLVYAKVNTEITILLLGHYYKEFIQQKNEMIHRSVVTYKWKKKKKWCHIT